MGKLLGENTRIRKLYAPAGDAADASVGGSEL
jgi:hypothetical protein